MNHTARFAILAAVLLAGSAMFAADTAKDAAKGSKKPTITLRDGRVLEDAYVLDKKPNGITIAHKNGCMFIRFSDMPVEFQQKFKYDPIKSARYERKEDEHKKVLEKEQAEEDARAKKRKEEQDKRYRDRRINQQQQRVLRLEVELEEAKKRLDATEKAADRDRGALVSTINKSRQVCIESPWGYGGRIRTSENNNAVRNRILKEADTPALQRDSQAKDVAILKLKLEAAQKTLDTMIQNGK